MQSLDQVIKLKIFFLLLFLIIYDLIVCILKSQGKHRFFLRGPRGLGLRLDILRQGK